MIRHLDWGWWEEVDWEKREGPTEETRPREVEAEDGFRSAMATATRVFGR